MKRGEKIMFVFAGIVVIAAVAKGYQQITLEDRPPPRNYYEWDETGLEGHLVYRKWVATAVIGRWALVKSA